MKLVVLGLTISSSWGNGHATLWRALCRALSELGHRVVFFERDVPYYEAHRDYREIPGGQLILYRSWEEAVRLAEQELRDADVGIVTSYCPDGIAASELIFCSPALRVFYDLDTPVTLARLRSGEQLSYIGPRGLRDFDLVLSFTGGRALDELKNHLGAGRVAPLYGCVDPAIHRPVPPSERYRAELSYLGTYATDRQPALRSLFIEPARRLPLRKFLIGGSLYPADFPWTENIFFVPHVSPEEHATFYCSSRLTLNITRGAMAAMGYCPSGRLFEAAACGTPILSDFWEGLDQFFEPGSQIRIVSNSEEVAEAIVAPGDSLASMARLARERVLSEHTAKHRARELEESLHSAIHPVTFS